MKKPHMMYRQALTLICVATLWGCSGTPSVPTDQTKRLAEKQFAERQIRELRNAYCPELELWPEDVTKPKAISYSMPPGDKTGKFERACIEVLIDEHGNVIETKVVQADSKKWGQIAASSIKKWRYIPATRNGVPIPVTLRALSAHD